MGQAVPIDDQPLSGLRNGGDAQIASKVLEVCLVGGEGSRAASGEEDVEEVGAIREGRQHGTGFGEGRHGVARMSLCLRSELIT